VHSTLDTLADERKRLSIALDAAELGTWHHDLRSGLIRLDARAQRHFGLDREAVTLETIVSRGHPEDAARLRQAREDARGQAEPERSELEYRIVDPGGATRHLRVLIRAEFEGEGAGRRPVVKYGTTQDVTETHAAQRLLREQALLLREVGEIAQVGGWEFDLATGAGRWTEETWRIHGLKEQPTTASSGLERFEGEARGRIEAALHEATTRGTPYDLDLPFTAADGQRKWVRAVCQPVLAQGKVVRLRGTLQDITRQKLAELALARFVKASPSVIYALSFEPEGLRVVWLGGDMKRLSGWEPHEASAGAWWIDKVHPDDRPRVLASSAWVSREEHLSIEFRFRRQDGTYFWLHDERRLLLDASGQPSELVGSWSDVTGRVELEARLRQSQKLEAIGQLAGGVAHDFNNLLTVIMGSNEVLAESLPRGSDLQPLVDEIRAASERAANLTRQLLAFGRKQILQPGLLDLNAVFEGFRVILPRLLGNQIAFQLRLDPAAGHVLADQGQIEQILLNLAINARDAMPRGGSFSLATDVVGAAEVPGALGHEPLAAHYLRLTIRDTGEGMTAAVQSHIFEPFFTTKPAGRGTGLGLATVFGIVKQSAGFIEVQSAPGEGTSFHIFFPRVERPGSPPGRREAAGGLSG